MIIKILVEGMDSNDLLGLSTVCNVSRIMD